MIDNLVTKSNENWYEKYAERDKNSEAYVESGILASKVLLYLKRNPDITRMEFSNQIGIADDQLSAIVKGNKTFEASTIIKINELIN